MLKVMPAMGRVDTRRAGPAGTAMVRSVVGAVGFAAGGREGDGVGVVGLLPSSEMPAPAASVSSGALPLATA